MKDMKESSQVSFRKGHSSIATQIFHIVTTKKEHLNFRKYKPEKNPGKKLHLRYFLLRITSKCSSVETFSLNITDENIKAVFKPSSADNISPFYC